MAGKQNTPGKKNTSPQPQTGNANSTPNKKKANNGVSTSISRFYPILLAVVSLFLYFRTSTFSFVKMDDADLIVQNEVFLKNIKNLPRAFQQSTFEVPGQLTTNKSYYRPILMVSLMLDARFTNKKNPAGPYHLFNLIYHILASIILYYLLKKLCNNPELALVLSLLFALHPVNVHAVAWVMGRNDILLAIFTLLSLHGLVDYKRTNDQKFLWLHLAAFAFALFTKESGVLLLVIYFLFMLLWEKDVLFFWRNKMLPLAYIAITGLWFWARWSIMHGHEDIGGNISLQDTFMHNLPFLFLYIGKILLPFNLNVSPAVDTLAYILGALSLAGLGILFYNIKDRGKAVFSITWFFMLILPTLLVPELPAFEHRDYLPLIGLLIGISQVSFLLKYQIKAQPVTYIFGGTMVLFFILSSMRLPVFAGALDYWTDGSESSPPYNATGCINVGHLYQEIYEETKNPDLLKKAKEWYEKGLNEDPKVLNGNNDYGAVLYFTGKKDEAAKYFQKEIDLRPKSNDPIKNMAIYYREKGEPDKSVPYWQKLIKLNRLNLDAYQDLADYYQKKGDTTNAKHYASEHQRLYDSTYANYKKLK